MWWVVLVGVGVFVIVVILAQAVERRNWRKCFEEFSAGRLPMTNEEFLTQAGCPAQHRKFCLECRRFMAELGGISPELIHPSDSLESLLALHFDGGDWLEVKFRIEQLAGIKLKLDDVEDASGLRTFADLVQHVIAHIKLIPAGAASESEPRT